MTFPTEIHIGRRRIAPDAPTYLIAEIGSNHDGDFGLACELIDAAAQAGWDAVKFQLFRAEWLYPPNCGVVELPSGTADFFPMLEHNQLAAEWLPELKRQAEQRGLAFLCTPFDEAAVATLARVGAEAYKVASPELNHLPLLEAIAAHRKPMICSTGLCTMCDIEEALDVIGRKNPTAAVVLLQCVSSYPTPPGQSNLAVLATLARAFGVLVGFSDHTTDCDAVPAITVAAGGRVIEKHITQSRRRSGPDHSFAVEPGEMRTMAAAVRAIDALPEAERMPAVEKRYGRERVLSILGHGRKEIMPAEAELYPCDKRSIHALRPAAAGEVLSPENIRILRSERNLAPGIHPRHYREVLGARLVRPLMLGEGLRWEHLLDRS